MTSPEPLPVPSWQDRVAEQDGVLARWQVLACGLSVAWWDARLSSGRWRTVLPGIAVDHSGTPTDRQRAWAAVLHGGPGAALSGDVALVEQGFRITDLRSIDVAVPWPRNVVGGPLLGGPPLKTHGVRRLAQWVHPVRRPPVVLPEVAVLHAAAWASSDRAAEWRIAAVVQQRLTTAPRIRARLEELKRLHRRALLREVLDDVEQGAHASSELDFLRFCDRNGLPRPDELQVRVRAGGLRYLDARYREQRVSVELDGAHHRLVAQWDADALRSLQLAVAHQGSGETLVRLTGGNLRHDEPEVAGLLRSLLL